VNSVVNSSFNFEIQECKMAKLITSTGVREHEVVSRNEWIEARKALLQKEKEFTHLRDQLSRQRRELPWVKVEKQYEFDAPSGKVTLADLFENRSQLIVYHFMFNPKWDEGCPSCSFWADNFNSIGIHLNHRDVSFVAISRAPLPKIESFKQRMGWTFQWVSSFKSDFNYDYHVSFTPEQIKSGAIFYNYENTAMNFEDREGASVFYKEESGAIYHTYSAYGRGIDLVNTAYNYLDLVPKGRDEEGLKFVQSWVRYHDRYDE
jgi:Uncharacterized protein conserved in bacteria